MNKRLRYLALGFTTVLLILCFGFFSSQDFHWGIPLAQAKSGVLTRTGEYGAWLVQAGRDRYQQGQYAAAAKLWQEAAMVFATQGDRLKQAMVLGNLALADQQLGQWSEANQAIESSLQLLGASGRGSELGSQSGQLRVQAQVWNNQGGLQLAQGQAEQALVTWQKATKLYQQLGHQDGTTKSLLNQIQALRTLGFYRQANERLEDVNVTLRSQPDSALKLESLLNLGDILRSVGNLQGSQTALSQAFTLSQTLKQPESMAAVQLSLGNTAQLLQQPDEALHYYKQATTTSSSLIALQAQANQLRLLIGVDKVAEAKSLWLKLRPQLLTLPASRTAIYAQVNVAQTLLKLRPPEAPSRIDVAQLLTRSVQQSRELSDRHAEAYALGYLGHLYEEDHQLAIAQQLTEQALNLAQVGNAPEVAYRWQWQLGRLLKARGDQEGGESSAYPQAIAAYTEAISTLRSLRNDLIATNLDVQFSFRESVEPVYRQLVALLLQRSSNDADRQKDADSQKKLKQAREVIESLQLAELDNFFQEACLNGQSQPIDQIDTEAAVIYPIILPDRLEVILSLPNQPLRHYAAPLSESQLETLFRKMQQSMELLSLPKARLSVAQQIYDLLIRPAEADLAKHGIKTLTFVLDGALKNLPMAALHDGHHYLIEKYAIALTPGLQLLKSQPLARKPFPVLVGGLTEASQGFSPLPGVAEEVQQIQREASATVLLNQAFTDKSIRQEVALLPFPVVHLATHGQFSSDAENTFILLWNQRLTVKALGELLQSRTARDKVPIELLILSACQTAVGDNRAALGMAGVAVRSGARSTLATLWSVNDQSTSLFMSQLYHQLTRGNVSKAEAVRQAQLTLLKQEEYDHPYYWAPFVLLGNWL